jgi:thioredoxin 1
MMPVFDTPITTNEQNLQKVLAQPLPLALYLFRSRDPASDEALNKIARENAGKLLIARVNVTENPPVLNQYGNPALPALVTLSGGQVKSKLEAARPDAMLPHIDYLLGRGPMPAAKAPASSNSAKSSEAGTPVHISDATFQQAVLQSDVPVLVDFWAEWCGPCHSIAPYLEKMAGEYAGKIKIAKLNVDENQRISQQYGIQAIPTFITFKNGKQIRRQSGADPNLIRDMIQGVLSA